MLVDAPAGRARARFDLATDADDPEIGRVLRENPMPGAIRISHEREPDARLAAPVEGPLLHQTIVDRRPGGGLFGFGTRSARIAFINGEPRPLGYLGSLHLDDDLRGCVAVPRQGYHLLRKLHVHDRVTPLYLTSIPADNTPARRVFESNVRGLPTYRFEGEFVTLVMRVRRNGDWAGSRTTSARRRLDSIGCRLVHGTQSSADEIAAFLSRTNASHQFAPQWTASMLESRRTCLGPAPADFYLASMGGRMLGCAALWDQYEFKQSVVRGYTAPLAIVRPMVNVGAAVLRRPTLLAVGEALRSAFISHVGTTPGTDPRVIVSLVEALHGLASDRELDHLAIGFAAGDPQLGAVIDGFGGRQMCAAGSTSSSGGTDKPLPTLWTPAPHGRNWLCFEALRDRRDMPTGDRHRLPWAEISNPLCAQRFLDELHVVVGQ